MKEIKYFIISLILISCSGSKPLIKDIPEIDSQTPIYYNKDESSLFLLSDLISFGSTTAKSNEGKPIALDNSGEDYLIKSPFNYPFGRYDYSYILEPTMSKSAKYLIYASDEFGLINISFNKEIDVNVLDLTDIENKFTYRISLPSFEYEDEKYQIPWSEKDEAFFAIQNDSLFKINPSFQSKELFLVEEDIYNFSVSKSEKKIAAFIEDTLWICNLEDNSKSLISTFSKTLGMNRKYLRSFSWNDNSTKLAYSEGWSIYIYNILSGNLDEIEVDAKVFSVEWVNDYQLLIVSGKYPSDMSTLSTWSKFSISTYSLNRDEFNEIHTRINHEPLSIKPRISPSKQLILFSEKELNGPYQVKLMTIDGQYEKIIAEGYLPFWGK